MFKRPKIKYGLALPEGQKWAVCLGVAALTVFACWGMIYTESISSFFGVASAAISLPPRLRRLGKEKAGPGEREDSFGDRHSETTHAQTETWRALIDAMPDAAVALNTDGVVVYSSRGISDLFPNARNHQSVTHISRNPEFISAIDQSWESVAPIEVQFLQRIPVERRISANISRLRGVPTTDGQPALLVTFRDLSESDKLNQMRADFVANASHELRTPLASLRGYIETLQGAARQDSETRDKFLAIMWSQADRMSRLIDDLLSLSRIEMRAHLAPRGKVRLNDVLSYVAQSLQPLAEASKITIHVKTDESDPARIRGDRDEIVQVVQNLVHNAIKYGRENGTIRASVTREQTDDTRRPKLILRVADDGPGIERVHLPRLTERFYRANVARSREKGGTGLGLAIVRHIVLRHGADLRIQSEVGKGSTFSVIFDEL